MLRKNIRTKAICTILSASMLLVYSAPSFAESIRNTELEQKDLRHRTKFVISFYSDSARRHKVGPTQTYIEKGLR